MASRASKRSGGGCVASATSRRPRAFSNATLISLPLLPLGSTDLLITVSPPRAARPQASGVVGFRVKEAPAAQLAVAIRRAMAGERVVDPALAVAALSGGDSPLTDREREVLSATGRGSSIAAIAQTLFLSEGTVRNYLS